jgi:quercetin dioxygenase-like cupin family protein
MSAYFTDWNEVPGRPLLAGQLIWSVSGEDLQVVRSEIDTGSSFARHVHPHEQIIVVLAGTVEFTVGEETRQLGPGGVFLMPAGVPHEGRVVGAEKLVIVEAFHPPRLDYAENSEPTRHEVPR